MLPLIPGHLYHIFNHSNGSELLFRERKNYYFFLKKYELYIDPIVNTYAYCLMPNHFHFLVAIKPENIIDSQLSKTSFFKSIEHARNNKRAQTIKSLFISKQFANLFSSYTQSYNKVYVRMGSLFMKNFKRKIINTEMQLKRTIIYIHLNPLHHGFVDRPEKWLFSSYNKIIEDSNKWIDGKSVLELFEDLENFKSCHQ
jgi:REP element-mobilizing transposase RayT